MILLCWNFVVVVVIVVVLVVSVGGFVYVGGLFSLGWLSVICVVDVIEIIGGGVYVGFCCVYVKGICIVGSFIGSVVVCGLLCVVVFDGVVVLVIGCFVEGMFDFYVKDFVVGVCSMVL